MQLAGERIIGTKEESYTNSIMQRGIDLEKDARVMYEFDEGLKVIEVGLVFKDDSKTVSCSPDGLVIGDDGKFIRGLEIKCPLLSTHVEYLVDAKLPTKYVQQVQGSMYVTGLDEWDFLSYYPGMPIFRVRVLKDQAFHDKLAQALHQFVAALDNLEGKIREKM